MKKSVCLSAALCCITASSVLAGHDPLPSNFRLHGPPGSDSSINYKSVSQADALTIFSKYYNATASNTQYFKLPKGTVAPDQSNTRIEAYCATWKASSASDWHYWRGTYYIAKTGQSAALLQMKSPDASVAWECQLKLSNNGNIYIQDRKAPIKYLAYNMLGKSFDFYIRSNGREYRGWVEVDGKKKYFNYTNSMDSSGNSKYAWRWGLYVLSTASDHEVRCWDVSFR